MRMILYWRTTKTLPPSDSYKAFLDFCQATVEAATGVPRQEPHILNVECSRAGMRYTFSDGRVAEISAANKIYQT